MKMELRSYQSEAIKSIFDYFGYKSGNPLIAAPTGTGKSVIIAGFCETVVKQFPTERIWILTHVKELVGQNYEKLMTIWPQAPAGINSAGLGRRDLHSKILFAGIASLIKSLHILPVPTLIIIDEAHLVGTSDKTMYRKLIKYFLDLNPNLKVIGLTATPYRIGQGMLTDEDGIFTDICFDITTMEAFNRLIEEGFLSPVIPKRTVSKLDVDGVHRVGGDFNQKELQIAVDKDAITEAALREALELAGDRQHWLIFSSGIHHGERIAEMLDYLGISNVIVHSKMSSAERDANIAAFKAGKVRAAVNYGVLTTGFDYPEIDCIIMLRPTESPVLWVQMIGRGTRPLYAKGFDLTTIEGRLEAIKASAKQNCLVLDYARNTARLGPINDPRIPNRKGKGGGEAPVKLCNACDTYNHASVRFCINCGAEFTFEIKINSNADSVDLIKPNEFPQVEVFGVNSVTYQRHEKVGAPSMIKVTYYTYVHSYSEYLCFEHQGPAKYRAHRWWKERACGEPPSTVTEALQTIEMAKSPTHIRVIVNRKYPEITGYCFDGTAFGEKPAVLGMPTVEVKRDRGVPLDIEEDDIPF